MDDWNVKRGVQAHNLRRDAAWTAMLKAAAQQHSVHPITAKRIKTDLYVYLYGDSARVLVATHGVPATTIKTLRGILGLLLEMAEDNGSPPAEVFKRFEDFSLADKRTRNTRRSKPRAEEEEAYPYISLAGFVEISKT